MRKLLSLTVVTLLAVPMAACEERPTELGQETQGTADKELEASHGSNGEVEANGIYRTVDSRAAEKNGFTRAGEKIGTVSVVDDGSALSITGEARGLTDDDGRYISLTYDKASPAQGPHACEPGVGEGHPLFITGPQMIIGPGSNTVFPPPFGAPHAAWVVDGDGTATLGPSGTLQYVPVERIGTISIRDLTVSDADLDGDDTLDPGAGPEAVVACAKVTHTPTR